MTTADGNVIGTTRILDGGDPGVRWNVVLLGDGYQAAQLGQYAADAQRFVDTLVATPPFDKLRPAINVFRVDVASTDSGADDPIACGGTGSTAATYFDASFCSDNVLRRLLNVTNATAFAVASAQVPQWHMVVVIVNSTVYGGSGGGVAVYSLAADAVETALHEMGHTAFGLADEYGYFAGCGVDTDRDHHPSIEPTEPNVTTNINRSTIKWGDLIAPSTPLPTTANPDCSQCDPATGPPAGLPADVVGAFEGAHYYHCGAYRPQFDCRMRTLSIPYCSVCTRQIRTKLTPFLPTILQATGRLSFLRVHDVGTGFGPPADQLDVEVVVAVDAEPGRFFGFQLRTDVNEGAHAGMLDTLRTAFNRDHQVRLDYRRVGLDNGILLRVADLS